MTPRLEIQPDVKPAGFRCLKPHVCLAGLTAELCNSQSANEIIYIYIYIYMCVCVCVCVFIFGESNLHCTLLKSAIAFKYKVINIHLFL